MSTSRTMPPPSGADSAIDPPPPATASRLRHAWRRLVHWRGDVLVAGCDRAGVLDYVADAAAFSPRFAFMTMMACGIAVLGLLQNSGAVIIGAMLISPLMGPIVGLGMGLATFDLRSIRGALRTLAFGVLFSITASATIVWLSPLRDATPEILARTSPTLFDLLVAVFSGLAGAYAMITRKGETLVGVAIATALMPPLAVVGFGIAQRDVAIALGAAFLFMTNLLAIALSVTIVARVYGFGGRDSPRQSLWQALLIVGTFAVLSVPLAFGLRRIALQSQAQVAAREVLEQATRRHGGRVTALKLDEEGGRVGVDALLLMPEHVPGLAATIEDALRARTGRGVDLHLREVITASDASLSRQRDSLAELRAALDQLRGAQDARSAAERASEASRAAVAQSALGALGRLEATPDGLRLQLDPTLGFTVRAAYRLERRIAAQRAADASAIAVVPPVQPLPAWPARASATASEVAQSNAWALRRWGVAAVRMEGVAASPGAQAGAALDAAVDDLQRAGIEVDAAPLRTRPTPAERALLGTADVLVRIEPAVPSA